MVKLIKHHAFVQSIRCAWFLLGLNTMLGLEHAKNKTLYAQTHTNRGRQGFMWFGKMPTFPGQKRVIC